MTYEEVLEKIHSRRAFSAGGPTLDRIRRLMAALGDPQEYYKSVHIAGTNGKGSVSAMTAAALRESGFRVGLFTSPYLVNFRERIQIDGTPISKEELTACYEIAARQETLLEQQGFEPVNEFELVTAIGFLAFSRAKVDYAVLEVGLGGRTDPTNLISRPAACCITSISLDHTTILGDTVEQIAAEKAGIIKDSCPVVFAKNPPQILEQLEEAAKKHAAPVIPAAPAAILSKSKSGTQFLCSGMELCIPLLGDFQVENASAAISLCKTLQLPFDAVKKALREVRWPGRLQYLPGTPEILVDAGHNPAGIDALCRCLDTLFPGQRIISILSMMGDKDAFSCIPMVAKRSHMMIGTTVGLPRSMSPQEIAQIAAPDCSVKTAPHMEAALAAARQLASPENLILVCGSVYGAGAALKALL